MRPPRTPECAPPDAFPADIENRPALDHIAYRIGRYADVRRHLLRRLDEDPAFAAWTYRGADDPGIALYEGAALLVDILTLYQEAYANEAFLRTATWRESISDLVQLLGYRLRPAIGGTGSFAFEVSGSSPVPIPGGFPINADLANVDETTKFQTRDAATALPHLSRFSLYRPQTPGWIRRGAKTLVIESATELSFAKNDRVLVTTQDGSAWETVIVERTSTWHGRTVLELQGALRLAGSHRTLVARKLGRSFRHFGHNAPSQRIHVSSNGTTTAFDVSFARTFYSDLWFNGGPGAAAYPWLEAHHIPLEPQADDLALGSELVFQYRVWPGVVIFDGTDQTRPSLAVARVLDARAATSTYGGLSGPTTIVTLDSTLLPTTPAPNLSAGFILVPESVDLRQIQIDAVEGDAFTVGAAWTDLPSDRGDILVWWGDAAQARELLHRAIAVVPANDTPYAAAIVAVASTAVADISIVTLDREVAYADFGDESGTFVLGNLVPATQGKEETLVVLGNGDDRETFQTFAVPKSPLTYLAHPELTPPDRPEIEIVVGARVWRYVASLYGHGPSDEVYIVRQDHDGRSWVQFGDGKTGARVPSGVGNVKARYRSGAGAYGPSAKPDLSADPRQRIDAITGVTLPGVIAGGSAAESEEVARIAAPLRVQSLDRLVSLSDIEAEALSIGGVERSRATWTVVDGLPMVQLVIVMQEGRTAELSDVRRTIAIANRQRGPQRFPIDVVEGRIRYVQLDLEVAIAPGFDTAPVHAALRDALAAQLGERSRRGLAEAEYATRVEGWVQNVRGVAWNRVIAFAHRESNAARAETIACAPTELLRLSLDDLVIR
ncbi:MAG: hypothetical protein AB7T06_10430 [Kofleriaceae bacterium]